MSASFTASRAGELLQKACAAAGVDVSGAELVRLGENAIYRLNAAPVVVRIARSPDRWAQVERELCVARWLGEAGVPVIVPWEEVPQPLLAEGHPVSLWQAVPESGERPGLADLAELLAGFHAAGAAPCSLPAFDPLVNVRPRLEVVTGFDEADREFLLQRCAVLEQRYASVVPALPPGPIHGDAHRGNLLHDGGRVVLLDFEAVAVGPREWDLIPTAVARERIGVPEADYQAFVDAYGVDVRDLPSYPVLRDIRELTMTTWLMQLTADSATAAEEFQRRMESLREGDTEREWRAF